MTRKDYEKVAEAIREAVDFDRAQEGVYAPRAVLLQAVAKLSATFAQDNPRFSAEKFYEACGY